MGMGASRSQNASVVLDVGKVYRVTHQYLGTFTARAIEPGGGWCGFCILEANDALSREGFNVGEYVELTANSYKARAL